MPWEERSRFSALRLRRRPEGQRRLGAVGERIRLRHARSDEKDATDFRHGRVVTDDLAVVQQSSQVALYLVEGILSAPPLRSDSAGQLYNRVMPRPSTNSDLER